MKLSSNMLNSARRILSGFNGATTTTLGDFVLSVKAKLVTRWGLFSIVEDLGPYNAIMGRTWMHSMKVVPSTYHQMTSYLTSVREVDLLSSQLVAQQCYQLSMHEHRKKCDSEQPPWMIRPPHRNHSMQPTSGQKKRTYRLWIHWKK